MRTGRRPVRGHRHGDARPRGQAAEDDRGQTVADADGQSAVAHQPCRIRSQSTVGGEPAQEAGADEDAGCPGHTHVGTAPGESFEEEPEEEGTADVDGEDRHRNPVDLGHGEADRLPGRGAADAAEEGETEEGHAQMGGTVHAVSYLSGMLTPTEVGTVVGKPGSATPRLGAASPTAAAHAFVWLRQAHCVTGPGRGTVRVSPGYDAPPPGRALA